MNSIEAIEKLYIEWQEWQNQHYSKNESLDTNFNEKQKKCIFLSNGIIGLKTYDDDLDNEFGRMILDTLIQIKNKTTFEYIKDKSNYRNFILSCNFIDGWLEWGTSIRGAWFNTNDGKIIPSEYLGNIDYDKEYIEITDEFMDWFVDWLSK